MSAVNYEPGRMYRASGWPPALTSAEIARVRLHGIVPLDRAAVLCGMWCHVRSGIRFVMPPPFNINGAFKEWLRARKPAYRWKVRR